MDSVLVFLLFLISLVSETNLNFFQASLEVIAIFYLSYNLILRRVISKDDLRLVIIFAIIFLLAIFTNPIVEFLLNFKIYLLAILTLIYFKKKAINSKIVEIIVFVNIFILLFQVIFNIYLLPTNGLSLKFQDLLDSRPLGLFYNTHLSAFVIAIYFIYKANKSHFIQNTVIGAVLIFLFSSKFTLFAYIGNFISKFKVFFRILIISGIFLFIALIFFMTTDYVYMLPVSGRFILQQLLDFSSYKAIMNPLPIDYNHYLELQKVEVTDVFNNAVGNEIGNEVQFFTLYIEGGFVLATAYLYYFVKSIKAFQIFIIFSLIHYGFVTTPFIIFLLLNLQNKIEKT